VQPGDQLDHADGGMLKHLVLLKSTMENIQLGLAYIDSNCDPFIEAHV